MEELEKIQLGERLRPVSTWNVSFEQVAIEAARKEALIDGLNVILELEVR